MRRLKAPEFLEKNMLKRQLAKIVFHTLIGRDCGFKSYSYLVKLFGAKTGLPPQKFRRKSKTV